LITYLILCPTQRRKEKSYFSSSNNNYKEDRYEKLNDHFKEILENVGIAIRESSNSKHKLNNIKLTRNSSNIIE